MTRLLWLAWLALLVAGLLNWLIWASVPDQLEAWQGGVAVGIAGTLLIITTITSWRGRT